MPSVNHSPSDSSINILSVRVFRNTDTQNAGNNARDGNDNASVKHQKGPTQPGMDFAKCCLAIHRACGPLACQISGEGSDIHTFAENASFPNKAAQGREVQHQQEQGMPQPQYTIPGFRKAICSPQLSSLGVEIRSASSQCQGDVVLSCPVHGLGGYKEVSWPFFFPRGLNFAASSSCRQNLTRIGLASGLTGW